MIKLNCMLNVELLSFVRQFEDNVNTCVYSISIWGGRVLWSVIDIRLKKTYVQKSTLIYGHSRSRKM